MNLSSAVGFADKNPGGDNQSKLTLWQHFSIVELVIGVNVLDLPNGGTK